jgi:hypothetical protein
VVHGLAVLAPAGIWVLFLIQWMVMGEVDGLTGVLGISAAIMLAVGALTLPVEEVKWGCLFLLYATIAVFVPMQEAVRKRGLARIDFEQMESCYDRLRERPQDSYAVFKLAELLVDRGFPSLGLGLMIARLEGEQPAFYEPEFRRVRVLQSQGIRAATGDISCPRCRNQMHRRLTICSRCEAPIYLLLSRAPMVSAMGGGRTVRLAMLGFVAALAIPLIAMLDAPPLLRAALAVVLMSLGSVAVVRAMKGATA